MRIRFLGAAGEVTGSCFLVETAAVRFLVDCGLFQGGREAARKNLMAPGCDVRRLDFILLTHAHLDHSGLLPRLAALGFRGPVYATAATADLLRVMLLDAAHIQEKEAEWQARHRARRGRPHAVGVLYTVAQAQACLRLLQRQAYDCLFQPHASVKVCLRDAGHILGSAIAELWIEEAGRTLKLVFSGDLGMPGRPVLRDPSPVAEADVLLIESTYGNRLHKSLAATEAELIEALEGTLHRKGGNVLMPAFSVGRTQEVLFVLAELVRRGRLAGLRVVVDSPMATAATEITMRHGELLDEQTHALIAWQRAHPQAFDVRFVEDVEESIALNRVRGGLVIISASGMCEAGRIKYHLLNNLGRPECTVLITGFQAAGTLGRRLVDGARRVTIFGQSVPVRADIRTLGGLSAHADQRALLAWLGHLRRPPRQTFVVHGEAATARLFATEIEQRLGWRNVVVPQYGDGCELI